jgi:hypothetical protein
VARTIRIPANRNEMEEKTLDVPDPAFLAGLGALPLPALRWVPIRPRSRGCMSLLKIQHWSYQRLNVASSVHRKAWF